MRIVRPPPAGPANRLLQPVDLLPRDLELAGDRVAGPSSSTSRARRGRSSSVIPNPRAHTGRLNRLAESRGLRFPRRPVVLPLPPCLLALRRDLLRRNPSAFVPRHRARHHPRAPPASLLRRRVRPRLPPHGPLVPRTPALSRTTATLVLRPPHAVAPRTQPSGSSGGRFDPRRGSEVARRREPVSRSLLVIKLRARPGVARRVRLRVRVRPTRLAGLAGAVVPGR